VADNSTYPTRSLAPSGISFAPTLPPLNADNDPSAPTAAVLAMRPSWEPVDVCLGGTSYIRAHAESIIPQEPSEARDAYERRIFHATMPPFLTRLASQAAGIILRKGIQLEGDPYWDEWRNDVTGDGTTLDEYARRQLITALLYGHSSTIVDYSNDGTPRTLAEERQRRSAPYLVPITPHQVLGWRTSTASHSSDLAQVRIRETVVEPSGAYGEDLYEQVRVMTPGGYELWRSDVVPVGTSTATPLRWRLYEQGSTSLDRIPLVTVYSNRRGNLLSTPPLQEVAHLCIAYAQRFCDYHHAIHVGANPMLVLRGFDPDSDTPLGISVNTALLLPPDGGAEYVQPTSEAFDAQLKCLEALEDQISRLGINTLTQSNITNAAAEARRLDRVDSDSIMAVISGDLERAVGQLFELASSYVGVEPPRVVIPRDYENRLLDGNQVTAYLQLYMQRAISQRTLLKVLQDGEVLPATLDLDDEISAVQELLEEQLAMDRLSADDLGAGGPDMAFQSTPDGVDNAPRRNAGQGESLTSQTLPTPMRPGRNAS
jgi:hypothetical protein